MQRNEHGRERGHQDPSGKINLGPARRNEAQELIGGREFLIIKKTAFFDLHLLGIECNTSTGFFGMDF